MGAKVLRGMGAEGDERVELALLLTIQRGAILPERGAN